MRGKIASFACAAATLGCLVPAISTAREPLHLAPATDWRLLREEDKCRLARTFGTGEDRVVLMLDQSGPQVAFNVWAIGEPMANPFGPRIGIVFGPSGAEKVRGYIHGKQGGKGAPFLVLHGVSLAPPDQLSPPEATELTFSEGLNGRVTLETGPLSEPVGRLRACATELAQILGHGRLAQAGLARMPQPATNPGEWLNPADYPSQALRTRTEGLVRFRLTVNKQGKATSCYIQSAEAEPDLFEDQVCLALLRRASFTPALDPDGKPVAAYWSSSVRFEIAS
jgi:TonB family protein